MAKIPFHKHPVAAPLWAVAAVTALLTEGLGVFELLSKATVDTVALFALAVFFLATGRMLWVVRRDVDAIMARVEATPVPTAASGASRPFAIQFTRIDGRMHHAILDRYDLVDGASANFAPTPLVDAMTPMNNGGGVLASERLTFLIALPLHSASDLMVIDTGMMAAAVAIRDIERNIGGKLMQCWGVRFDMGKDVADLHAIDWNGAPRQIQMMAVAR